MKYLTGFLFVILISLNSCSEKTKAPSMNGVWEQLGYGKIYEIKNDSVKIYDVCKVGCHLYDQVPLKSKGVVVSYSVDSLLIKKNIKTYRFKRLEKLPAICWQSNKNFNDPIHNFETLWNTFNENYCFFELRNINWDQKYNSYKSRISSKTSALELFNVLNEMLSSINDDHIQLYPPDSIQNKLEVLNQKKGKIKTVKQEVSRFQLADKIANQYCQNIKNHNSGIAKWGLMKNNIAYVQINAMWLMAYYDIPKNLSLNEFGTHYGKIMDERIYQRQDEIDGANLLMDTIVEDLKNSNAMVIDLRFNTGGKDEVGLEIIGHLTNHKKKIASKKAKFKMVFTNHQNIYLEQRTPHYNKDVYVLTSPITASAAEIALMATLPLDNVTRIGSNTEGIFSDGLDKKLPNGWEYTLSNEIYEDVSGINYEAIGIEPNLELNYPRVKGEFINLLLRQLRDQGDSALEKVFHLEKSKTNANN